MPKEVKQTRTYTLNHGHKISVVERDGDRYIAHGDQATIELVNRTTVRLHLAFGRMIQLWLQEGPGGEEEGQEASDVNEA